MVGSQTTNLTPNFVLGYNIYFTSPNEKCKFICYIYILNFFYDIQIYWFRTSLLLQIWPKDLGHSRFPKQKFITKVQGMFPFHSPNVFRPFSCLGLFSFFFCLVFVLVISSRLKSQQKKDIWVFLNFNFFPFVMGIFSYGWPIAQKSSFEHSESRHML